MKKGTIIILGIVAILALWCMNAYNDMVKMQENVTNAAANVQSAYQRRADLIPNLVETVKGYATHEENTFKEVVEARAKATQIKIDPANATPEQIEKFQKAQGELGAALGRLIAVSENYPELKANENFMELQKQLEGTENRINTARNKFNEVATSYNQKIRSFPTNILAGFFHFDKIEKFAAEEAAQKAPTVKF